jgi:hypothetical protein
VSSRELPRVELPSPEEDRPAWGRVGVIAALGFVVGVAWPRLAGVSLGPNPPADAPRAAAATATASAAPAKTSLSGVTAAPAPIPGASGALTGAEPTSQEQGVTLGAPEISRCRDLKGKAPDACDKLAVEGSFEPRLKELSRCPSALGLSGKVSFSFDLDFKNKTLKVQRAKAKLPRTTLDGLTRCVEKSFNGVSLDEISHENNRYSIAYEVSFLPPGSPAQGAAPAEVPRGTPLSGKTGKISWGSCQVREAPAKNASVIGKLPRKAEVKLLEEKDGWYRIEFNDKQQAWIFGEAVSVAK